MNTFLKTYRLALTPLSPIHIGCGEDFLPTNYVIDDGVLYGFDPSRAVLNDLQRSELNSAVASDSLLTIQRFFKKHAKTFQAHADVLIPVAAGVAQQYADRVGKVANRESNGRDVFNQLAMERSVSNGISHEPYIPGSSFKGAVRTAWLDELNQQHPALREDNAQRGTTNLEKRLLQGDFSTSPLRLLKVSDLMPSTDKATARRVLYSVNLKKKLVMGRDGKEIVGKGPSARKECILHGQYRAYAASAVVQSLEPHCQPKLTPMPKLRPLDLREIAARSNAYHLTRLRRELAVLDGRGFVNPDWKRGIEGLLNGTLGVKLKSGDAFLIRLGRYGGAESKTLSGEGVANIKIMGARVEGKQQFTFETSTKTVWLAAEYEHADKHLLPFGWAVVEIDPQGDLPELKAWCNQQALGRPDMVALRQQFEEQKRAALLQKAEQLALAERRLEQEQTNQFAQQQQARKLASLSEQGRLIETLRVRCENWAANMPPNGNFKRQDANIAKAGLFQDGHKLVAQALANSDWQPADKAALADMLEQHLPPVVAPWGKDEKKKLKLSALRGQLA